MTDYLAEARRQMSVWTSEELQNVVDAPNDPGMWDRTIGTLLHGRGCLYCHAAQDGDGYCMADRYGQRGNVDTGLYHQAFQQALAETLGMPCEYFSPAEIAFYKSCARSLLDERMLEAIERETNVNEEAVSCSVG